MKITCHRPKNRWSSPTFTIRGISRDKLSLLLSFALDGLKDESNRNLQDLKPTIETIDRWINHEDSVVRMTPLEL